MAIEITMPRLSDTMEEGTLNKWRVKVGDKVSSGDVLADVETDKATMELNSFDEGTVAKLAVQEGDTTKVGSLIMVIAEAGENAEEVAKSAGSGGGSGEAKAKPEKAAAKDDAGAKPAGKEQGVAVATAPAPATGSGGRTKVSPLARKIAEENNLNLSGVAGSGPDGRIIKRDVQAAIDGGGTKSAAAAKASIAPAAPVVVMNLQAQTIKLNNMRKTIAKRLVESKTQIPHFTVTVTVNMDPLLSLRTTLNQQLESQGVKLSVNDFIVRASALALVQHPIVNSTWTGEAIEIKSTVNIGVAVSLPAEKGGGLVVPTIRDTHNKGLRAISTEVRKLATKAREQGLTVEEMSEGTFTISNLGMLGVEHFEAIINPPQAAILAVGAAIEKPVVRKGQIVAGHEMTATLSADHRVLDGAIAAEFLQTLKGLLENPAAMLV